MTDPIVLEVVGVPESQGSKSAGVGRNGRAFMLEKKSGPARARLDAWRKAVADAARAWLADYPQLPLAEPVAVRVEFRFAPVASDRYRTLHSTKPDLDKIVRSTFDALVHGGLLGDDASVCMLNAAKRYALIGESVGATVTVRPWGAYEAARREDRKAEAARARTAAKAAS